MALWESSNASHDLPALELLNSQHSLEISSVCQRLLVELDCSQNSSSSILSKVVIARESPKGTTSFKVLTFHWSNDRKCARKSQPHACADVFQLCHFQLFRKVASDVYERIISLIVVLKATNQITSSIIVTNWVLRNIYFSSVKQHKNIDGEEDSFESLLE